MKALVTAGGRGTRLRPITHTLNKHLIPIANKPMIAYVLEKLKDAGITEIGMITNPGDTELSSVLGDGSQYGVRITYLEQIGGPLGLAHVVKIAQSYIGNDSFLFFLGDNIIAGSIKPLIEKFEREKYNCLLALAKVSDPQRFGVPELRDGKIIGVQEKPVNPKSNYAVSGIYLYDHYIFEAVNNIIPSDRGELEISDAHQYLIDKGLSVGYEEVTGWWKDTGKPKDLLEGNSLLLSEIQSVSYGEVDPTSQVFGQVRIGKNSIIKNNSVVRGPVSIGDNCVIDGSYIGPYTSVGDQVKMKGTEIEHSIIFSNCEIDCPTRIIDSLIGNNSKITSSKNRLPYGKKFVIGENTSVEI